MVFGEQAQDNKMNYFKNGYTISTDKNKLDLYVIHNFLAFESSWSRGISLEKVRTSIENSLNFGIYKDAKQVAYARILSDYSTVAYIGDLFISPAHRKLGLSLWLIKIIMAHPKLQHLQRWVLLPRNAEQLFEKFGFSKQATDNKYMEKYDPSVYLPDGELDVVELLGNME